MMSIAWGHFIEAPQLGILEEVNVSAAQFNKVATYILVSILWVLGLRFVYESHRDRELPPGPPRIPFIGNLLQAPSRFPWLKYHEWSKKYGPIFSVNYAGSTFVFIADPAIARNLLDKRAASDRPKMEMLQNNVGKGFYIAFGGYNERYRVRQHMLAPILSTRASASYQPIQDLESKHAMYQFLFSNDFRGVYTRFTASVMFSLVYGSRTPTGEEQEVKDWQEKHRHFGMVTSRAWLVDLIPALNRLPAFLAPWKRYADRISDFERSMHLRNLDTGLKSPSWNWAKALYNSKEMEILGRTQVAYDLGFLVDAGLETTSAVLEVFTLAAVTNPEVMRKAQKELDEVVGRDRLPSFEDKSQLPYVIALISEVQRWRTISPLLFPHAMLEEVVLCGYRVPKGAAVFPLIWSMNLDDSRLEEPLRFSPERWLDNPHLDAECSSPFGYGRRACGGRDIAKNTLFIIVSRLLWGFDIRAARDKNGREREIDDTAFTSGLITVPQHFDAVFEPRSSHRQHIIEKEFETTEKSIDVLMSAVLDDHIRLGIQDKAKSCY